MRTYVRYNGNKESRNCVFGVVDVARREGEALKHKKAQTPDIDQAVYKKLIDIINNCESLFELAVTAYLLGLKENNLDQK